jgi:hypothetical protein
MPKLPVKTRYLRTTPFISAVLLLTGAHLVAAQTAPNLAAGSRVRVHVTGPKARVLAGRLISATPDSVRLLARQDTIALAIADVASLDVTKGRRTQTGKGALLGAGIGAGLGLVLGLAASAEGCSGFCTETGPEEIGAAMLLLGGVGGGIGALVGAASHTDRWVPAPRPWLVIRVNHKDRRLGCGLRVSIMARHSAESW